MSFAENLLYLRKREGITQEQMAETMGVSRQTISKWEAGSTYPEMEKIIQICDMFGCTMDVLLKGDVQSACTEDTEQYERHMNLFNMRITGSIAVILAGVMMQILLTGLGMNDDIASIIFIIILIPAILMIIVAGMQHENYRRKHPYIEDFYTEEVREEAEQKFIVRIVVGIGIILTGLVVMLLFEKISVLLSLPKDIASAVFFMFIVVGSPTIVYAGMQKSKYDIAAYNKENMREKQAQKNGELIGVICGCIMLVATIIFLYSGLVLAMWKICWIVYPIGGMLCGIVAVVVNYRNRQEK